jgi:hypothetical protein
MQAPLTQTFRPYPFRAYHKLPLHSQASTLDSFSRHSHQLQTERTDCTQTSNKSTLETQNPTTIAQTRLPTKILKEMARGGRGGGSRNPANQSREVQVSRKVSWLLRHGANSEGLKLGKGGYVNVQDAVSLRFTPSKMRNPCTQIYGMATMRLILMAKRRIACKITIGPIEDVD